MRFSALGQFADEPADDDRGAADAEQSRDVGDRPDVRFLVLLLAADHRLLAYGFGREYGLEAPADTRLVEPLAQVLINLGIKRGMVVYGQDKLDEISMSAPTTVCEIRDGWYKSSVITPEDFGFTRCAKEELRGGTPGENAKITLAVLNGERGPKRNAVLMNAGAALYIGGKAASMKDGITLAAEIIDSGKALATLRRLIEVSNRPINYPETSSPNQPEVRL